MSGLDAGAADATIRANHATFAELADLAEQLVLRKRSSDAADAAAAAAGSAWMRHAGIHTSPRLERLIRSIAPGGPAWRPGPRAAAEPERVLHVLTQVYPTGGHTRWSDRIIRADAGRVHSVVVVAQGQAPIPDWLRRSVAESGGSFHVLSVGGVLQRAAALGRLVRDADPHVVVANVHPNDVASVIALADPRVRPPVAALNHADHTFWLGAPAWDVVVDFRVSGQRLARRRRGVTEGRGVILPLPSIRRGATSPATMPGACSGSGATRSSSCRRARAWKFDPLELRGEPTFPEVLAPIVAADPRLRCFVLGPLNHGRWADAARATDARLLALGTRTDYELYQQAADVYLDPFPMGSTYSLLEPGSRGVPLLTYDQWPGAAEVLTVDSPGLGDGRIVVRDRAAYEAALAGLIDDRGGREARGARTAGQILAAHAGEGWQAALDALFAVAPVAREAHLAAPIRLPAALDEPVFDDLSRALATIPERTPPVSGARRHPSAARRLRSAVTGRGCRRRPRAMTIEPPPPSRSFRGLTRRPVGRDDLRTVMHEPAPMDLSLPPFAAPPDRRAGAQRDHRRPLHRLPDDPRPVGHAHPDRGARGHLRSSADASSTCTTSPAARSAAATPTASCSNS